MKSPPKGLWVAPSLSTAIYCSRASGTNFSYCLSLSSHKERGKAFWPEKAGKSGRCRRNSILPLWSRVGMGSNPELHKQGTSFILVTLRCNGLTLGSSHRLLLAFRVTPPAPGVEIRGPFFLQGPGNSPCKCSIHPFYTGKTSSRSQNKTECPGACLRSTNTGSALPVE